MLIDMYRLYSKKSTRKNRIFKYACIFSVILAVGIIFSVQLLSNVFEKNISTRIKAINGTNIKIIDNDYLKRDFSEEQLEILKKATGECNYTLAYCDNSNLVANGTDDMAAVTVLNNTDIISALGIDSLNDGQVAISKSIAERLNIQTGDKLYLKLHSGKYIDRNFEVTQILNDNVYFSVAGSEYEMAQEALGCVYLVLPEIDKFNTAYVECMDNNVINTLKGNFEPLFDVRTVQELSDIVIPRIQLQMEMLKLVSSIAMIISSICLVWSFFVFIMDRKNDFLIFKKIGIHTIDLSKLLLLEIYAVVIKGILLGIPLGGAIAAIYLQKNGGIEGLAVFLILKNIVVTILLVLIETAAFSLMPIFKVNKMIRANNTKDSTRTPIWIIILVSIILTIVSCIYVKSFMGIVFFGIIGMIFGIFYFILIGMTRLMIKIMSFKKNGNFLFINDMKKEMKISSFSLTIVNICMVITFVLLNVIPMLYSTIEAGTNPENENISYRTLQKTNKEKILIENNVEYYKYYTGSIEILKINGIDIDQCINKNIVKEYKEESIKEISNREINIYANAHMPDKWKGKDGFYINNIYKNVVDFKKGDLLNITLNEHTISCKVAGVYEDTSNKDVVGIISELYMKQQGYDVKNTDMPVIFTITGNMENNIVSRILLKDDNAYIDRNKQLSDYLKRYIDNQKAILAGNIVAVGFSGILLVLLGQLILFVRKKDYYTALWKIGMSKRYLMNALIREKCIVTLIQIITISIILEPIRFLINAEMATEKYSLFGIMLLIEVIVILAINLFSVFIPFLFNKNRRIF